MSTRYSRSPELHLTIARSRYLSLLQGAYLMAALVALAIAAAQGYPGLASLMALVLGCSLPRLAGQPDVGTQVSWRDGRWCLVDRAGSRRHIEPCRDCRVTPWAVLLVWHSPDAGGRLWVAVDAVPPEAWRLLRVRLRLAG